LPFFAHFEIDIITALADQLTAAFAGLEPAPLRVENLAIVPSDQGVYHLFRNRLLVYVGKADNLRKRLSEHRFKIMGRCNIDVGEMAFACLTVHKNWTALAPEDSLIKRYRQQSSEVCEWNGISFGPHDPGRDRETTNKDTEGFDAQFPIKDDLPCDFVDAREWNVRELLIRIKEELPFLLRYEAVNRKYREGHPDYNNLVLAVPAAGMPVSELLRLVLRAFQGGSPRNFPAT
jgi:hypothetical protein